MNRTSILIIAALLLLTGFAWAGQIALPGTTETAHFIIHYPQGMDGTAVVLGRQCEDWLTDIRQRLDLQTLPLTKIPVSIYRDQQDFTKATGHERPGEVVGLASSQGYLELDVSGVLAPPAQIAGHEIVHLVIFRILGPRSDAFPLWANEGTAKYMTDDFDNVDRTILADAATSGRLLPLSSLNYGFPDGDDRSLAYAEGTSAVTFFVKTYGERSLARLIHATARTGSFDTAMREVTGASTQDFERRWMRNVEGTIITPQVVRIVSSIGLIAVGVLIIGAYIGMRRRKQRLMERYALEEWQGPDWRDWSGGS
jgi:hypothetical protein